MAQELSEEQKAECKQVFDLFDDDKDGVIPLKDFGDVIRSLGCALSESEVNQIVEETDKDGNGTIDYNEFQSQFEKNFTKVTSEEDLLEAFRTFDADGNGVISRDELMKIMTTMGESLTKEEAQEIIDAADIDKDGFVNYQEFVKMMTG